MPYRIVLSKAAERELRRVRNERLLRRLSNVIGRLGEEPYPPEARKLQGAGGIWRIRVGDWRICYTVDGGELVVLILTVARRDSVYERLRRRLS